MAHATIHFPDGFLWGTATASHQVEGNNTNNNAAAACTVDDGQASGNETGNASSAAISPNTVAAAAPPTQEVRRVMRPRRVSGTASLCLCTVQVIL